jgi:hypothetical protein
MCAMENEYHLKAHQVIIRILAIIVCGIAAGGCAYSLTLQVQEVGTLMASLTWFSSLLAAVFAMAGYASSCDPGKGKSYVAFAVVCIAIIGAITVVIEKMYLYDIMVINISLVAAVFMGIVLIIYHYILKHEDPDAL